MTPALLGYGIVGCGGAAVDVVAAMGRTGTARIAATFDLDPALARDLAAPAGATPHPSLEALLADPAVEAVYVGLPHDLLAETAGRALAAGRAVLVEKPMALDAADIDRLGTTAGARGLALGVLYELRETGPVRLARRLVRDGAIGEVTMVRVRTLIDKPSAYWESGLSGRSRSAWRASRARAGGGVLLMNTIHQLDIVAHVTGLTVARARGETGTLVADRTLVEVEDAGAGVVRYAGGAIGSVVASAHSAGADGDETIEIDGQQGSLRLPYLYAGDGGVEAFLRRPHQDLEAGRWLRLPAPLGDPFRDAIAAFTRAVRDGTPAAVGARDAAAAHHTVQGLYASQHATEP